MSITSAENPSTIRRRWKLAAPAAAAPAAPATAAEVLIIQRGEYDAAGLLGGLLTERGLRHRTISIARGHRLPAPDAVQQVILLGGDDLKLGASPEIIDWAAAVDRAGGTIFATGTGAQALARALGGDSAQPRPAQRGWISVRSADPELISSGPWFAWSDRPLVPPPGSEVLASSSGGVQAFRIGRHIGVQFHPQATPDLVREWVSRADEVQDHQGLDEATVRDFPLAAPAARRLLEALLNRAGLAQPLAA